MTGRRKIGNMGEGKKGKTKETKGRLGTALHLSWREPCRNSRRGHSVSASSSQCLDFRRSSTRDSHGVEDARKRFNWAFTAWSAFLYCARAMHFVPFFGPLKAFGIFRFVYQDAGEHLLSQSPIRPLRRRRRGSVWATKVRRDLVQASLFARPWV